MDDSVVGGAWQVSTETRHQLRLAAASSALRARNLSQVVLEVEELLDEDPRHREALWLLAQATTGLRDTLIAVEAWETLIEAGEDRPAVWAQLAAARFEAARYDDAVTAANTALAHDPDLGEAHYVRALVAERREGPDAAWVHYQRAHRLGPHLWPLPLLLTPDDVTEIVARAMGDLHPEVADLWSHVPVRLEAWPEVHDLTVPVPPISPRVLALYEGSAPIDEASVGARPTSLRIYAGNLSHHEDAEQAAVQLADALEQEAFDWLPEPLDDGR